MKEEKVVLESNLVKWFSKVKIKDINLAGEKGANLGELKKLKIPMPDGFIITTKAYDSFLQSAELSEKVKSFLNQIDISNEEQLDNYITKIRKMILETEFPEELREEILESYEYLGTDKLEIEKGSAFDILNNAAESIFVAVRSSLPFESFRTNGLREQDTYLNVKGKEELLVHVKKCFASLFNVNTIKRYLENGSKLDKLKIAVIVQKMIEGEKAGVIYSRDSSGRIIIRSIWGLGEGMNLGEVNPDKFIVSRELEVLDQKIHEKKFGVIRDAGGNLKRVQLSPERSIHTSLSNSEIQRLGDLALKVEENLKHPQELEFVIGDEIFIVQTKNFGLEQAESLTKEKVEENKQDDFIEEEEEEIKEYKTKSNIERVNQITKTKLKLIIDSPNFVEDYRGTGLKKVGFFKLENLIFESGKHPLYFLKSNYINEYENLIYKGINKVVNNFEEVWIRTSDFLSDKFNNLEGAPELKENNPLLGLHGIRYGLKNSEVLEAELRAFKRANPDGKKVGILIPGITSVEQLQKVRDLLIELDFEPKVGIMLETPAAVQLIKDFADAGINRILIETDNLIQYLLGIDLNNKNVQHLYDELHPALKYQLEYVIRVCKRRNIETSIAGRAIKNKELLKYVVQREVSSVCIEPEEAKYFSDMIFDFEEELFGGTDKEPRQYELQKEKEEYLEEVPKTMEDLEVLGESEKAEILISKETMEEVEMIEKEKQEYLSEHPEEAIDTGKNFDGIEEILGDDIDEIIEEEKEENNEEEILEDVEEAVKLIEKEKQEYLSGNLDEEFDEEVEEHEENLGEDDYLGDEEDKKDPLGIF